jgi:hypothetical protein
MPAMSFADWLLPLLLLSPEDEHGRLPFDWSAPERTDLIATFPPRDAATV